VSHEFARATTQPPHPDTRTVLQHVHHAAAGKGTPVGVHPTSLTRALLMPPLRSIRTIVPRAVRDVVVAILCECHTAEMWYGPAEQASQQIRPRLQQRVVCSNGRDNSRVP
jgi:hypothetical protein